ncbi:LysR family transcriptional regulator [Pseudomonas alloputida]|uniref:LysR family transcriptional regulator n=1 Tax=Pseudomonas alloputida TaxID=1940621 RepID=A0ABY3D8A1_9PSED|nr:MULTISPECIES: LysR family transcriptional regulator [Pseudomonas]EKT4474896.1 LysR family transcriptional regulator [Pseudomonas putida]MCX2707790.1 LysR family transcriptional regulator [Pseudomonas sp. DCB_BG]MDD2141417.1 LysR family transcriptional regulator [Pseudomonas putida]TRZ61450.1 LysR family transcriptional regulator [Pseudomonas alloputida]HDS1724029.1 LysR family transcriptional regulator [Pseudomonas putida]
MTLHANWDDLRLLLAVSRRGSFLQAGQLLGIAASTLSRRLTQLEVAVGEPLVERGVEGCRLTSRGQSLVEVAIAAESGLRRQTLSGTSQQPTELSGSVLVSAGEGFSDYVLEAIRRFTSLHSRCSVELTVAADFHKIARGVADVAVRTAHLGEPSLIYRPIGRLAYGIFAAPGYLKQFPGVTLTTAVSVSLLPPLDILPQMRAAKAAGLDRAQISVNSFAVQLQSVKRGMGVAVLPRIAATDLVELFPHLQLPDMEIYLVTRPQALKQAHIKCFFDTLEGVLLEAVSSANATVVPRATC